MKLQRSVKIIPDKTKFNVIYNMTFLKSFGIKAFNRCYGRNLDPAKGFGK